MLEARPRPRDNAELLVAFALGLTVSLALAVGLSLAVAGCGSSGGGGGGSTLGAASGSSGGGTTPGYVTMSATAAQLAVAQQALSGSAAPLPVGLDPAGLDAWQTLLAESWPRFDQAEVNAEITTALQSALATPPSGAIVQFQTLRNLSLDTLAPPGVVAPLPAGTTQAFTIELPRAPGTWAISFAVDATATLSTTIAGVSIGTAISLELDVAVTAISVEDSGTLDLSDPTRPAVVAIGAPQVALTLALSSQDPVLSQIAPVLTQALDPIVRAAVAVAAQVVQQRALPVVRQWQSTQWGLGAPPVAPLANPPALEPIAEAISDEIQKDQMPFDAVYPAIFDQLGYGNGSPVDFYDFGDSVGWTGVYIAAESLRYDLTGDARALAAAGRGLRGITNCLDAAGSGSGFLARCAIPLASPVVHDVDQAPDYFTGTVGGVPFGATSNMSRDHYMDSNYGATFAWLHVPALRAAAAAVTTREVDYLAAHDWDIEFKPGSPLLSIGSPFPQAPSNLWALLLSAGTMDPGGHGPIRDRAAPLTSMLWFNDWASSREIHDQYFKFQLAFDAYLTVVAEETDPARYRDYVKGLEILRDATGHHDNAMFDATWGAAVPAAAPALAAQLEDELDRWTLRPRRGFDTHLQSDPTIATASYGAQPWVVGGQTTLYAVFPVPIEKRPCNDFLWQIDPFDLDGGVDPHRQYPGLDLIAPYWLGRAYGMLK